MTKRLIGYFIAGLAIALPFALSALLLYLLYSKLANSISFQVAIVVIAMAVILLTLLGYLANSYVGASIFGTLEEWLIKLPLLGPLYKSSKDITSAFVGSEGKFSEPVMVRFPGDIQKVGFVTSKQNAFLSELDSSNEVKEDDLLSVYFPLSFSLSGDLFLVPRKRITPINQKANIVMQTIISGGLISRTDPINIKETSQPSLK